MKKIQLVIVMFLYVSVAMSQTWPNYQFYHADTLFCTFPSTSYSHLTYKRDGTGRYNQVVNWISTPLSAFYPKYENTIIMPITDGDKINAVYEPPYLHFIEKEVHSIGGSVDVRVASNLKDVSQIKCNIIGGEDGAVELYRCWRGWYQDAWFTTSLYEGFEASFDYTKDWEAGDDGETREVVIELRDELTDCCDTLTIIFHLVERQRYRCVVQPAGDTLEVTLPGCASVPVIYTNHPDYMVRLADRIDEQNRILRFAVSANDSEEYRTGVISISPNNANVFDHDFFQPGCNAPSLEEQKAALMELYYSTNGDKWSHHDNWFSDKPISQWYGVNEVGDNGSSGNVQGNYIVALNLRDNNLRSTIPPKFTALMSAPRGLFGMNNYEFDDNYIYGDIPQEVKEHPYWPQIGWDVIQQLTTSWITKNRLNLTDSGIKTSDAPVTLFVEDEETTVYDIIKQNELTLVMDLGPVKDVANIRAKDANTISDDRVNLYLDYCNKGLGMVATIGYYFDYSYDELKGLLLQRQQTEGLPAGIRWVKGRFGDAIHNFNAQMGNVALLDKDGNLVCFWRRVFDSLNPEGDNSEKWYNAQADSIIRLRLGEPEAHEPFVSQISAYQSTDFSRDGEVVTLQKATRGQGIDVVLMGDLFVDKDMEPGGVYESTMRDAMEMLFSVEPFTSLRDRFNIYVVKVVAKNNYTPVYTRINNHGESSSEFCFNYAERAEGVSRDKVTIISISNGTQAPTVVGESDMSYKYSSVNYLNGGGVGSVLLHELGHGFGKLYEEYDEWFGSVVSEEDKETIRAGLNTFYWSHGWGQNVSPTNNPDSVFWKHFLNDSRYADEVGIYDIGNGLWKSSSNSLMTNGWTDLWYNAPSREAIYKQAMKMSEGEDWAYDYEKFVEFDTPARQAYQQTRIKNLATGTVKQTLTSPLFVEPQRSINIKKIPQDRDKLEIMEIKTNDKHKMSVITKANLFTKDDKVR